MRNYAYFYWIGVVFPTCFTVAIFVANWIINGLVGVVNFASAFWFYIGLIALFTMIGFLLRPLRPNKPEALAFMIVGLIAAGILTFILIMGASLVTGLLGG